MDKLNYSFDQENNYRISLNLDRELDLYATTTNIPGLNLGVTKVYGNKNNLPHLIKSQRIDYNPLNIQFVIDDDWNTIMYFYDFIKNRYLNEVTKVNSGLNDRFNITVYKTNSFKKMTLEIKYYDCSIIGYNEITKTSKLDDIEFQVLDVNFEYSRFEISRLNNE